MHLIRRAALRAASSPSTSFISQSRSLTTASPFVLRSKAQSPLASSVFRRFNSDEASKEKSSIESADSESGSVRQAVESAAESASTYASQAAESFSESVGSARDAVSDAAATVGAAAGAYTPRQPRESSGGYPDRQNGGDRQVRGGGFGGNRNADRFGSRNDPPPPEPSNGIYVGNLVFDLTAADLEREFAAFGTITKATVATDARGLSKGFGYVEFESVDAASKAIEAKHQSILDGRTLVVNYMRKSPGFNREPTQPSKTLFIGNLAFEMSDADLNKLFRDIKNVIDVRVAIDRRTGQPRGFAHADFVDVESAIQGKEVLSDKEVYGRKLRIDFSAGSNTGRGDGAPRGGRGGGYGGGDRRGGDRRGGGGYGGNGGASF